MKKTLFSLAALFSSSAAYAADGVPQSNPLAAFFPLIIFVAIFYFCILRPINALVRLMDRLGRK